MAAAHVTSAVSAGHVSPNLIGARAHQENETEKEVLQRHVRFVGSFKEIGHRSPRSYRGKPPTYNLRLVSPTTSTVPVIDLQNLHDAKLQVTIMHELVCAAREWGCFQLLNHGISVSLLEAMMKVSKQFFRLSDEEKMDFASTASSEEFDGSFRITGETDNVTEILEHNVAPIATSRMDCWPSKPAAYRNMTSLYTQRVTSIAHNILTLLSEGLGLTEDGILAAMGGQVTARLLTNNYRACSTLEEPYTLPSHTDANTLTFLLENHVYALEVQRNNCWAPIRCIPNTLTVLVGDHLQVISNEKFKSVIHRVKINPKQTNASVGVFVAPALNSVVKVVPELVTKDNPARFRGTTFKNYLHEYHKPGLDQTELFEYLRISRVC